jgi:telomeric repeat-binding factor 2-interacting protein 1
MDPNLADKVLEYLVAGKGIPTDMRGVWTAEDDARLEGTDARAVDRIHEKHGRDLMVARWEYLEFQREINLESQIDGPD